MKAAASHENPVPKRAPDQRYFDAMLIRAWVRDMRGPSFAGWVHDVFGAYPNELPLLRCREFYGRMHVRAFIGTYLRPLSDRLFDTPLEKRVELLDWLAKSRLDCELRGDRALAKAQRQRLVDIARLEAVRTLHHWKFDDAIATRARPGVVKQTAPARFRKSPAR